MPAGLTAIRLTTMFHDRNGNGIQDAGETSYDFGESGIVDPGDGLYTRVTLTNSGDTVLGNVTFSDSFTGTTLVAGSVNVSPIAFNDSYTAVGNTVLRVGEAGQTAAGGTGNIGTGPSFTFSGNLLANDVGSAANGVGVIVGDDIPGFSIVTVSNGVSAGGGTFNIFSDGSFNYVNQAGDTGTDTFTYQIRDGGYDGTIGNADDLVSTATVSITLTGEVWYVDSAGSASGTGTSNNPFNSITALNAANMDGAGDTIYVKGSATGGIVLDTGQQLIGQGADLSVNGHSLATAGANSTITSGTLNSYVVTVGQNNTIAGLNIVGNGTNTGGITDNQAGSFGTLNLNPASLNAVTPGYQSTITASGSALTLSDGTIAGNGFSSTTSTGGVNNVSLTDVTGSVALGIGTMSGATGAAINVVNTTASAVNTGLTYAGSVTQANNAALLNVDGGTAGHSGTITLTGTKSATNGTGLNFENADGTYTVNGSTNLNGGNAGIDIVSNTSGNTAQGSSGTFTFGGTFSITNPTGTAISISDGTAAVNADIDVTANNAAALDVTNHSGGTLTFQTTGSFTVNGGSGLQFTNADGTYQMSSVNSLAGTDGGIDILAGTDATNGSTGTFTFLSNTSINNTGAGHGFNLAGSDANVTFNGSITDGSGRAVSIDDHDNGTITFTSQSSINGTGNGIHILNSNAGDVNFNGQVLLSTGANAAITLTSNSGSTIDFAADDNGLDITTSTGRGIDANNGGTITITDSGTGNTITSVGGIAFYATGGTTIGAAGVTFDSISANGGTNGIYLDSTGAGGFTVLGDGGSVTRGGNASGGTIHNTTGDGIYLNNVQNVRLTDMTIQNNDGDGIGGQTVNGFVLSQMRISGNGDSEAADESGINISGLTGTSSLGSRPTSISDSVIENNYEFEIQITNSSGTLTNFRVLNNTIQSDGGSTVHGNLFNFLSLGTASMGLTVSGTAFDGNTVTGQLTGTAVHVDASGGTINADIGNSTFNDNNAAVNMSTATNGILTFNIHDNGTMTGQRSTGIVVFSNGNFTGSINGTIANNHIGTQGDPLSGAELGRGIQVAMEGGGTATLAITGNIVEATKNDGIAILETVTPGTTNATITGNTVRDITADRAITALTSTTGTLNVSIAGNTITNVSGLAGDPAYPNGSVLRISEAGGGTVRVTQTAVSTGATGIDAQNGLAAAKVSVGGTPDWGQPAPPSPSTPVLPVFAEEPPSPPIPDKDGHAGDLPPPTPSEPEGSGATPPPPPPPPPPAPSEPTGPVVVDDGIVSAAELNLIVAAAIERWADAGATEAQLEAMRETAVSIADLGGLQLGASGFGEIVLDDNAGGWRWFVDATPGDDTEYRGTGSQLVAADGYGAAGTRIDLLTVVMHELGHRIGLTDSHDTADRDELMYGTVRAGERRLPGSDDVAEGSGQAVTGAFAVSPINLGTLNPGMSATIEFRSTVDALVEDKLALRLRGESTVTSGANSWSSNVESLAVDALTLGNRVFLDNNKNNMFDAGDSGISGVTLTLFADTNNNGVYDNGTDLHIGYNELGGGAGYQAGIDTPAAPGTGTALTATTDASGFYSFAGLAPGDYIVRVDAANFAGVLASRVVGATANDPNNNVDSDNNGQAFSGYVATRAIRLDYGLETVGGPTGPALDTNDTLDIAFESPNQPPLIANVQGNSVTFTEGDAAVKIDVLGDAAVSDSDSTNYNGGSLTISISGGLVAAQDELAFDTSGTVSIAAGVISVGGTAVGTVAGGGAGGGNLVVTFDNSGNADDARVQTLIRAVTYDNSSAEDPTGGARTVSITLIDGGGEVNGGDDDTTVTATVNVVSVNDAPTGADNSKTIDEDDSYTFVYVPGGTNDFGYSDTDGDTFAGVTIVTMPTDGELRLDGVALTGANVFVSAQDIEDGKLVFHPSANESGVGYASFTFKVRDDGADTAPSVNQDPNADTFTFDVTALNDAPVHTVPGATQTFNEDTTLTFNTANGNPISVSDVDVGTGNLTVTLSVQTGGLTLSGTAGLSFATGDGGGDTTMTFTGTQTAINAALDGLVYAPGTNYNGDRTISITTSDLGNTGADPGVTGDLTYEQDSDTISVDVTGINDAPVVSGDGTVDAATITEDTPTGGDSVSDLFSGQYSDAADAQSSVSNPGGTSAGAFSGIAVVANGSSLATGQWQYYNTSTSAWVDVGTRSTASALLIASATDIRFNPAVNFNGTAPTLTVHLIDNSGVSITFGQTVDISGGTDTGGTTPYSEQTVELSQSVTAVNDAPTIDHLSGDSVNFAEGDAPVAVDSGTALLVGDVDSANFDGGSLTLTMNAVGDDAVVFAAGIDFDPSSFEVTVSGTVIGSWSPVAAGGEVGVSIALNGDATPTLIQTLLRGMYYANGSNNPEPGTRTVNYSLVDGDGGADSAILTSSIVVSATNTAPTFQLSNTGPGATLAYTENDSASIIAPTALLSDADSPNFGSGSLVVSFQANGTTADQLGIRDQGAGAGLIDVDGSNVYFGASLIGSFSGGGNGTDLTIALNGNASPAAVQALIRNITYANSSNDPSALSRTVNFLVNDGDGGATPTAQANGTVNFTAVNDAPTASNASIATPEDQFRTLDPSDFGYADVDGSVVSVTISAVTGGSIHYDSDQAGAGLPAAVTLPHTFTVADLTGGWVRFVPNANLSGNGAGSITFTVTDDDGAASTPANTLTVNIGAVNDAPDLTAAAVVNATEQTAIQLLPGVTVSEPDLDQLNGGNGNYAGATFSVNRNAGSTPEDVFTLVPGGNFTVDGTLLKTTGGLTFGTINSNANGVLLITFTSSGAPATSALVDHVIQSVRYTNTSNTPPASVALAYGFNDGQGAGAAHLDVSVVTVNIAAVNDAPLNTVPAAQAGTEDTNLVFSTGNGNAITVGDVDAGTLTVKLGVLHGKLTLASTAGLTFNSGANGSAAMTITGTTASLNAALNGLIYRGNLNYNGAETLSVTTSDGGATGSGGTKTDLDTVAISLAPDGIFHGNGGTNVIHGTAGPDMFWLQQGGDDYVLGHEGSDIFYFGGALTANDIVDGRADYDTIVLQGNYSGGVSLGGTTRNIEAISFLAGSNTAYGDPGTNLYDYNITVSDATFAAATLGTIKINGANLLAGEDLTFNGAAETNASFLIYGGFGTDVLSAGAMSDIFLFSEGRFAQGDRVIGGGGYDSLMLRGNYTIDFNAPGWTTPISGIENITLCSVTDIRYARGGTEFDYDIVFADSMMSTGGILTVSGILLGATETMLFDGSNETSGEFRIWGGASHDTLKGGGGADVIYGGRGVDLLVGFGGADTFRYENVAESTAATFDTIANFDHDSDRIDLSVIDAKASTAGDQAFTFIGSAGFASGVQGQLRAFQTDLVTNAWTVEGDINGDQVADLVIHLTVLPTESLTSVDFVF